MGGHCRVRFPRKLIADADEDDGSNYDDDGDHGGDGNNEEVITGPAWPGSAAGLHWATR